MRTLPLESVGRYELLIALAKGGMAELYLGRLHGVGGFAKQVAIKRILPHLAEDKQFVEMFLNEGRIAAQLSHPNVCQVYELGEDDGNLYLVMEYLDGVSWEALIKSQPRTPETLRLVAGVVAQACEGLHYAHVLRDVDGAPTPVIHRDVSPQNLFVTVDGMCKVLDFGVSKMIDDGPRTRTGVLKGKLPYMSPEQIQGDPVDPRSDVFALGVVVWEALTGSGLFARETDFQIWKAITEAPIPPLAPQGYPPAIDAVLGAALARDREQRFRSARALGEALRAAVEPIGGPYDASEIAAAVQASCGAQIAARALEVARIVRQRRMQTDADPGDTIEDHASSTVRLRPEDAQPSSTAKLRSEPVRVVRAADDENGARDRSRPGEIESRRDVAPHSRSRWPLIAAAVVAVATVILVIAPWRASDTLSPTKTPVAAVAPPADHGPPALAARDPITARDAVVDLREKPADIQEPHGPTPSPIDTGRHAAQRVTRPLAKRASAGPPRSETLPPLEVTKPAAAPVPTEPGLYSVTSEPDYATIFVDGKKLGDTPLFNVPLAPGTHVVRAVRSTDRRERTFSIEITTGNRTSSGNLPW